MVDVVVLTPGASVDGAYVQSLVATMAAFSDRGLTWRWVGARSSLVHHAREVAASAGTLNPDDTAPFGGRDYGTMLWVDSDISWSPDDALRLLDSPHDVTTGVYKLADGITTSVHAWGKPGESIPADEIAEISEAIKIQSCGFGFISIKRGVFERMSRPWFAHLQQPVMRSDGTAILDSLGEDISWCVRAYQAGIEIWLDPTVKVNHHKNVAIGW